MISKRYTAQYKMNMVELYLKENEENKVSKAEFALKYGISDSTFNDWVLKYQRMGTGFCNVTNEVVKLNDVQVVDYETPVVRIIDDAKPILDENVCRLTYNGATVEFNQKLLERVLNIVKKW